MSRKQWYEELFEDYGRKYDNEIFTQGTIGECDFIEKEINFDRTIQTGLFGYRYRPVRITIEKSKGKS